MRTEKRAWERGHRDFEAFSTLSAAFPGHLSKKFGRLRHGAKSGLSAELLECAMRDWPATPPADTLAIPEDRENHVLDVYLVDGRPVDLRLDGESLFPVWFKLEFKENGEVSAKPTGIGAKVTPPQHRHCPA